MNADRRYVGSPERDAIVELGRAIYDTFPGVSASADPSGDGGMTLTVVLRHRLFAFEYRPEQGFGVDEVLDGEGFTVGYTNVFRQFEDARQCLMEMLWRV